MDCRTQYITNHIRWTAIDIRDSIFLNHSFLASRYPWSYRLQPMARTLTTDFRNRQRLYTPSFRAMMILVCFVAGLHRMRKINCKPPSAYDDFRQPQHRTYPFASSPHVGIDRTRWNRGMQAMIYLPPSIASENLDTEINPNLGDDG